MVKLSTSFFPPGSVFDSGTALAASLAPVPHRGPHRQHLLPKQTPHRILDMPKRAVSKFPPQSLNCILTLLILLKPKIGAAVLANLDTNLR